MNISSSVVVYKTDHQELTTLLECVVDSLVEKIYIVDNSPSDELRIFADFSPKIEYVFGHGNVGFGAAHNIALQLSLDSGAKYHLVLNPDICFEKGTIEHLAQYMDQNPGVGMVMPKVVYPTGEIQYLCKLLPTPMDWIGRRFSPFKKQVEKRNARFELRASGYDKIMNVPYLSGCFMWFRNDVIRQIGLFDTGIFMYGEDTDITRRIHEQHKTIFYPGVTILHVHKKESHKNRKLLWIHIKAAVYYFNKWGWFFDSKRRQINKKTLKELNIR